MKPIAALHCYIIKYAAKRKRLVRAKMRLIKIKYNNYQEIIEKAYDGAIKKMASSPLRIKKHCKALKNIKPLLLKHGLTGELLKSTHDRYGMAEVVA